MKFWKKRGSIDFPYYDGATVGDACAEEPTDLKKVRCVSLRSVPTEEVMVTADSSDISHDHLASQDGTDDVKRSGSATLQVEPVREATGVVESIDGNTEEMSAHIDDDFENQEGSLLNK